MSLILHRSATTEALAAELAELLASSPADVFTPEVIAVGERGIERWLAQRLSHRLGRGASEDGVCAGLEIFAPPSFMSMVLGRDHDDPWSAEQLTWPLLASLDELSGTPGFEVVGRHLGVLAWESSTSDDSETESESAQWLARTRQSRRYSLARRLAGLFSSYAAERPEMLTQWEDGRDTGLPEDLLWQAQLWRAVCTRVAASGVEETPSARLERVCNELRHNPATFPVPQRVSFFAHTRFARSDLLLLSALAEHREIHLWMTHPSPALWEVLKAQPLSDALNRDADHSSALVNHPVLAALGRESRENEQVLFHITAESGTTVIDNSPATGGPKDALASEGFRTPSPTDLENSAQSGQPEVSRLKLLQADILANRPPTLAGVASDDESVAVHSCHGPARSVEVLRETLLDILEKSAGSIQPRDILIMCPDVETYAPLIRASFGATDEDAHPGHALPVRMADRGMAALNPLVDLALTILELVSSRFTASQVLDLAGKEPVAQRFDFDDDARTYLTRWVSESGIRWGLSPRHRREYGVGAFADNTWDNGLNRLALGAVMAADSTSPLVYEAPVDDVSGRSAQIAASFMELLASLESAAYAIRGTSTVNPQLPPSTFTPAEWATWLRDSVLAIAMVEPSQAWQITQFERDVAAVGADGGDIPLRLSDARALFERQWAPRPTRANFRTGAITVCTMVPMRSVPHKVVIALGMDDGAYPRQSRPDGDDVLARAPRVGERDVRSTDSELLLDAMMSSGEKFIAFYCGFDERTGKERPPAIALQHIISTASRTGSGHSPATLVTAHPLQAFDERNFVNPAHSFDTRALDGAHALRAYRRNPPPTQAFLSEPLTARPASVLTIDDLSAFFVNPAREFLKRRLEITLPYEDDEISNAIPLEAVGLDQWKIGDRYLKARLHGLSTSEAWNVERRRGSLPPGALARNLQESITSDVEQILAGYSGERSSIDISLKLDGVTLRGRVAGVNATTVEEVTYSTAKADHRIRAWIRLLALCASSSGPQVSVIRSKRDITGLRAPESAQAQKILTELIAIREAGLRAPLGIPPRSSAAYVRSVMRSRRFRRDAQQTRGIATTAAAEVWATSRFPENNDDWYAHIYGPNAPFDVLMSDGIPQFAETIWQPIIEAEARYGEQ